MHGDDEDKDETSESRVDAAKFLSEFLILDKNRLT